MSDVSIPQLLRATMRGDLEQLAAFRKAGADFTAKTSPERWGLLHLAFLTPGRKPPTPSLRYLVSAGVDALGRDLYGDTPLHYAVCQGDVAAVRLLLGAGADVHVLNHEQQSPLHLSLLNAQADPVLVQLLLDSGADPVQPIGHGQTVLDLVQMLACDAGDALRELFAHYTLPAPLLGQPR
jgi:ankyrin repeat protein